MARSRIHIVGIGGCATSGLARILHAWGHEVSGSDRFESRTLDELRAAGVRVSAGHRPTHVDAGVEQVVYSVAVPPNNPELARARRLGIQTLAYPRFLGQMMRGRRAIAVAGTHGKTTTSALVASILTAAGRDPSALIGGVVPALRGNWRSGLGPDFVVEACEYRRSFLYLQPDLAIVTNLERDHPDVYPDDEAVMEAFRAFVLGMHSGGLLVLNGDDARCRELPPPPAGMRVSYGLGPDVEWQADRIRLGARPSFRVRWKGIPWGDVELAVPGRHSIMNALAAVAVTAHLEVPGAVVREALAHFAGVERRFQRHGSYRGVEIVEDYAHHPTEIDSVIHAARDTFPTRRVWALFQPHQLGRLHAFHSGFARALAAADGVGLLPAYSVRESSADFPADLEERLAHGIAAQATPVHRFQSMGESVERMRELLLEGDVCLVIGAGDVGAVATGLCQRLGEEGAW